MQIALSTDERPTIADVTDETGTTTTRPLDYAIAVFPYYWLPEDTLREREQIDGLTGHKTEAVYRRYAIPARPTCVKV